ncbi:unnamed protein product [Cladocopium goreaui]|uniref:3-ketoacyl-CoA thiolase (Acetyl-Co A acyltransferase) (Beta-ketothiolase) n=1 Tax=Cladocopium goreaui TaxID=2562237 RepID=A0A9P1DLW4_9DINO|nr:unnamed protein product [Cladocopium goreaui]
MDFKPLSAYIVDACRTAGGKRNGKLSGYHPADLGAAVCDALIERQSLNGAEVEDVIFGCVAQTGAQAANVARTVVLSSRLLPETVPGTSVDQVCSASQQAVHTAVQAVMSGVHDCCIAGGVEAMSTLPIDSAIRAGFKSGHGRPMNAAIADKYKDKLKAFEHFGLSSSVFNQFGGAELLAQKYKLSRQDADRVAAISQSRAAESTKAGKFKDEIVPLPVKRKEGASEGVHSEDEGIRPNVTLERLGKMKALFRNGVLTAASSSQICDGAAAVLICNERGLQKLKLKPLARIVSTALVATDPVMIFEGPISASQRALEKAKLKIQDMDLYEALGADFEKLNVNGGAMALGHPLGCTGAKLLTTLVHELKRQKKRYGLLAVPAAGGLANATIVEMMPSANFSHGMPWPGLVAAPGVVSFSPCCCSLLRRRG